MQWSIIFSGASLILCVFFFIYFRAYLRRRTGPEQLLAQFREEVYKLIAEIDAATDKDAMLVEDRIKTLRSILEDTDKRISVYVREVDRRRFQEEAYAELGRKRSIIGSFPTPVSPTPKAFELFSAPEAIAFPDRKEKEENREKKEERENGEETEDREDEEKKEKRGKNPRIVVSQHQIEPKPLPIREQVLELSRAGLAPRLIALRLGLSIAEVETAVAIAEDL